MEGVRGRHHGACFTRRQDLGKKTHQPDHSRRGQALRSVGAVQEAHQAIHGTPWDRQVAKTLIVTGGAWRRLRMATLSSRRTSPKSTPTSRQHDDAHLPADDAHGGYRAFQSADAFGGWEGARDRDVDICL